MPILSRRKLLAYRREAVADWRDPEMPVWRNYTMANGTVVADVNPDYERRYREFKLNTSEAPSFKQDQTYNLRRK